MSDVITVDRSEPQPATMPVPGASTRPRLLSGWVRRALLLGAVLLIPLLWWALGYIGAYTDDAFLTSDLVAVTPEISGPIASVAVSDNQWVRRGTVLFTIVSEPFQLRLQQALKAEAQAQAQLPVDRAQLAALGAQQQSAAAAAALAHADRGRAEALASANAIALQALDEARAADAEGDAQQHTAAANAHKAAETLKLDAAALAVAQAARRLAQWRLSRTRVVAPVDGRITHLVLQPGDMATTTTPAIGIVDGQAWHVVANYKEYYLRHLPPGHIAWVWLDTQPWRLYRARIQGIAHGISRHAGGDMLVPYVSPTVDWIRLERRIPVRLTLEHAPDNEQLFMGADARVLVLY